MLTRRFRPDREYGAAPSSDGFRFVPCLNEGRMRGRARLLGRRRRARLTILAQALLAQLALDRERAGGP